MITIGGRFDEEGHWIDDPSTWPTDNKTEVDEIGKMVEEMEEFVFNQETKQMKNEEERLRIGHRIMEVRKKKGLTQEQLANLCGIRQSHIARIEAGKYSVGFDSLQAIAKALNADIDIVEK